MDTFYCDICEAPMVLDCRLPDYHKGSRKFRKRRFKCTVCDFKKTIIGDGEMDEKWIPALGIEAVKKMFEQEERNRRGL